MSKLIAQLSIATGIAPNDLLDSPPEILQAIVSILNERHKS